MNENEILGFDPSQLSVFNQPEEKAKFNPVDNLIYHARPAESISEDGIYRCTIKVIYNPFNLRNSILEQQSYSLNDTAGFFQVVSSLTDNDKNCPIFKAWMKCRYSQERDGSFKSDFARTLWLQQLNDEKNGGKALFNKTFKRFVIIQVISDLNHPELENRYMLWKMPKSVYELIDSKSNPKKDDNVVASPVMDFLFGKSIKLTVKPGPGKPGDKDYSRQTSYSATFLDKISSCKTPTGEKILNDEETVILKKYTDAMQEVWDFENPNENKEELDTIKARIDNDPNTNELRKIYARVLTQLKEWCPNLLNILGYKEWNEDVKKRVNNWIEVVLSGNDPREMTVEQLHSINNGDITVPENIPESKISYEPEKKVEHEEVSTVTSSTASAFDNDDDLPF